MNASPESLVLIIGKQQVMIEMLQEQVKKKEQEIRESHDNASGTGGRPDPHQPPAWAQATANQKS
jgi:hypothetical protein